MSVDELILDDALDAYLKVLVEHSEFVGINKVIDRNFLKMCGMTGVTHNHVKYVIDYVAGYIDNNDIAIRSERMALNPHFKRNNRTVDFYKNGGRRELNASVEKQVKIDVGIKTSQISLSKNQEITNFILVCISMLALIVSIIALFR